MNVLEHVYTATFALLALAVLFTLLRLVRGPSVLDRIVCLNTISVLLVSVIAVEAAARGDAAYIGLMVSIALLGFVATVTAVRFAERRAHDRD
ncbi:monovalent cation/H+ antiporter complex subunit F [Allosalinactinospora lopnorensis]|uniref:monovalent cation/H+ antiporter complex subunit F n=1 Tax=Allosalinactinospora lopnorensis TaxID=1352348 RepID=UPI000623BE2D|nr:monovalent cation/H+ antiporter complex subunit F [Allosalinactinospora lopnorensis]